MRPPAERIVTLYSRTGCHLCEQAEEWLRGMEARSGFRLKVIDIESDDDLLKRFMVEIPVVAIDGNVVAKAPLSRWLLEDLLV